MAELDKRGVKYTEEEESRKADLQSRLKATMRGIGRVSDSPGHLHVMAIVMDFLLKDSFFAGLSRLPALAEGANQMEHYEIFPCEALHDIMNVAKNMLKEMPLQLPKELQPSILSLTQRFTSECHS